MNIFKLLTTIKQKFKNPQDIEKFVKIYGDRIQQQISSHKLKDKRIQQLLQNSLNMLKYAVEKNNSEFNEGIGSFIKQHWLRCIICIYLIVTFIPGAMFGSIVAYDNPNSDKTNPKPAIAGAIVGGVVSTYYSTLAIIYHIPVVGDIVKELNGTHELEKQDLKVKEEFKNWDKNHPKQKTWVPGHYDSNKNWVDGSYEMR